MEDYKISLVIPVYNEGEHIKESIGTVHDILCKSSIPHEFVLVDDGSRDNTWESIRKLSERIPNIKALRLSRNFGKESALCAGLEKASGQACVIMDSDLQHPPELVPEMVRLWREKGFQVVEGVKASRGKESLVNKLGAGLFYRVINRLSGLNLDGASDFKLLDAKVVESWKLLGERNTFFRGMSAWVGFNRTTLPFEVAERKSGKSRWSLLHLFKLAVTAITAFSSMPLQIVTFLGVGFLIGSLVLGIQTLYKKLAGIASSGFTTVILLLLIIGSALMISLGIIGTYIAKIYDEVKRRPRYIISEEVATGKE